MSNTEPTITTIPVSQLRFDPENPRLPSNIDGHSEQAVLAWMLEDATVLELLGSIGEVGYFPGEPLLVVPAADGNDVYIVVEGNRRLSAVKLLLNPESAPLRKNAVREAAKAAKNRPPI